MKVTVRRALSAAGARVAVSEIVPDAEQALANYWDEHPAQFEEEKDEHGVDPKAAPLDFWPIELAEPEHADIADGVEREQGVFTLPLAERWMSEEDEAEGGAGDELPPAEGTSIEDIVAFASMPLVLNPSVKDEYGIPISVHYRHADACGNCFYYNGSDCTMFDVPVEPQMICDEWATKPPQDADA